MSKPIVSIVFPAYNRPEDTLKYLQSVYASDFPINELQVIMVDNDSAKPVTKQVSQRFPQVTIIRLAKNIGPGAAKNIGAKKAKGAYLLFTDDDQILEPKTLKILKESIEKSPKIGIISPLVLAKNPKGKLISCGYRWNKWLALENGKQTPHKLKKVDWVPGCCLMIRRSDFYRLGGHDEDFFFHGEDADLGLRTNQLGLTVLSTPDTCVWHGSKEPTKNQTEEDRYYYRFKFLMIAKHARWYQRFTSLPFHLGLVSILHLLQGNPEKVLIKWQAWQWAKQRHKKRPKKDV
jgi:hypothetical protein